MTNICILGGYGSQVSDIAKAVATEKKMAYKTAYDYYSTVKSAFDKDKMQQELIASANTVWALIGCIGMNLPRDALKVVIYGDPNVLIRNEKIIKIEDPNVIELCQNQMLETHSKTADAVIELTGNMAVAIKDVLSVTEETEASEDEQGAELQ
jgi:hypothetical protein